MAEGERTEDRLGSMSTPRWPVVIFDLNGTLAGTIPLLIASYEDAWRTVMGSDPDLHHARTWLGMPLRDAFALSAPEEKLDDLVAKFREFESAHLCQFGRPVEGLYGAVRQIADAGATLGVVTSKSYRTAIATLECVGLGDLTVLTAKEDVEAQKPSPASLRHALDTLGCDPADVVHVCDAPQDIDAARAAGIACVAVTWGAALRGPLSVRDPDAVVDSPAELVEVLTA